MMLWEVGLIIGVIIDIILCIYITYRFNKSFREDMNWDWDFDDKAIYIFIIGCIWFIGTLPLSVFLLSIYRDWIAYCWFDFWTIEITTKMIFMSLVSFFISLGITLCIGVYLQDLKESKCSCGKRLRGKYCRKCGKKRDA